LYIFSACIYIINQFNYIMTPRQIKRQFKQIEIRQKFNEKLRAKMDSSRQQEIDQTMYYLKANQPRFGSWAPSSFNTNKNKTLLRFFVRGRHHTGYVFIFLNGGDLFDVWIATTNGNIRHEINDLYNDQLAESIDKKIEYIPEYAG